MTHLDGRLTRRAALKGVAGLVIGFHLPLAAHGQSGPARAFERDGGDQLIVAKRTRGCVVVSGMDAKDVHDRYCATARTGCGLSPASTAA